jgi:hypothetical protein
LDDKKVTSAFKMASSKATQSIRASAQYKKKPGSVAITGDQKSIIWTPKDTGSIVKIEVADITSML